MTNIKKYSFLSNKKTFHVLSVGMVFLLSSCGFGGGKVKVLNCKGYGQVVYNTKSGRLYDYSSFYESWVPRKLKESNSRSSGGYTYKLQFYTSEDIKYDYFFKNGNLKIKKERKFNTSYGSGNSSGTEVSTLVIYDAKKGKENYKVKGFNNKIYNCKLDPEKKYRAPTFKPITIKGGVN